MTLRIGYVGAGMFSSMAILPQLSRHDVQLAAICDLDAEKADLAARRFGFDRVYTDLDAMCETEDLDAVFCVGGPAVHYPVAKNLLSRGLPTYVQKSPAATAALTAELADLAAATETICHVGFNMRGAVAVAAARRTIDDPGFGRPTLGIFRYGFVSGATVEEAVLDQHCHLYDTARFLLGDVADLQVRAGSMPGVRHYVVAATFVSGALATFNFTSEQGGREFFYFEVTGEDGQLVTGHQFGLRHQETRAPADVADRTYTQGMGMFGSPDPLSWAGYEPDVANFLAAVRGEAEDWSPVADAVGTMELCEEVVAQLARSGSTA